MDNAKEGAAVAAEKMDEQMEKMMGKVGETAIVKKLPTRIKNVEVKDILNVFLVAKVIYATPIYLMLRIAAEPKEGIFRTIVKGGESLCIAAVIIELVAQFIIYLGDFALFLSTSFFLALIKDITVLLFLGCYIPSKEEKMSALLGYSMFAVVLLGIDFGFFHYLGIYLGRVKEDKEGVVGEEAV